MDPTAAAGKADIGAPGMQDREGKRWRQSRKLLHAASDWDDESPCFYPDSRSGGGDGGAKRQRREMSPSDLDYYRVLHDYLRSEGYGNSSLSSRIGSVEEVLPGSWPPDSPLPNGPPKKLALLRILSVLNLSSLGLNEWGNGTALIPRGLEGELVYGDVAGFLLGIHHFNNGDGAVVKEVTKINETCPVRFVADIYDSEASMSVALELFNNQLMTDPDRPPSMILGATRSAVSAPLATLSGVYSTPQISSDSTSTDLDDPLQYPYFGRLIPSDGGTAKAAVEYFRSRDPTLRHLGVLYVNDAYGSAYFQAMKEAVLSIKPESDRIDIQGSPFSYNKNLLDQEEIDLSMQFLAETKFRIFFGIFYDQHYELVMEAAIKRGIAGPGYVWIVSDGLSETYLNGRAYPAGSNLAVASQGVGILKAEGGREAPDSDTGYDRFARAWYGQTEEMERYNNCFGHPGNNTKKTPDIYYQAQPGFFRDGAFPPTSGAVFKYDAVMAVGLAACGLLIDEDDDREASTAPPGPVDGPTNSLSGRRSKYFNGDELFRAFVRQEFEGASGLVRFDHKTGSRDPGSAFFVLYNAVGTTDDEGMTTTFAVDTVLHTSRTVERKEASREGGGDSEGDTKSATPQPKEENATTPSRITWVGIPGRAFVYSDGTTKFPESIPKMENYNPNRLSPAIRGVGMALAGIILATAAFFSWWTYRHRDTQVVRQSQPTFLQMVCAGVVLMGATIFPLSVDDGVCASKAGCDAACMISPWTLAYGFVVSFSALFAKTWRVNKIFHNPRFRRVIVTRRHVIVPFLVLFFINSVILSVWTAVSPLAWNRTPLDGKDTFGRSVESYGLCRGETNEWAPYVACLLAANIGLLVVAKVQAYRARSITTEYAESHYIAIIMMSMLQVCFTGIPLLVLVAENPPATFVVWVGILFVTCMSMLLFMFVPKMRYLKKWEEEKEKKAKEKSDRETKRGEASVMAKTEEGELNDGCTTDNDATIVSSHDALWRSTHVNNPT